MAGKQPTQATGGAGRKGDPGGTGVPADERGAGDGGPIGPARRKPFRGGQSEPDYHGSGQLGEQAVNRTD